MASDDPPARERRDSKVETRKVDSNDNVTDFNEYHLVRRLGAGAFAHVDLCEIRHPRPSFFAPAPPPDQFAVKVFNKSILRKKRKYVSDASGKMHFTTELDKTAEEIAIMKRLRHPNLVNLHEVIDDEEEDTLYMVLEFVPGGPIMDWVHTPDGGMFASPLTGAVLGEERADWAIADVLNGLAYLHLHHICHRDLKPQNILLDGIGRCKIADFGVAHHFSDEEDLNPESLAKLARDEDRGKLTSTEGTRAFWAPEMLLESSAVSGFSGYASDIWATGVCLFIFVLGRTPFKGGGDEGVLQCFEDIRTLDPCESLPDDMSPECAALMRALLTKDWKARISIDEALASPFVAKAENHPHSALCNSLSSSGKLNISSGEVNHALGASRKLKIISNDCCIS